MKDPTMIPRSIRLRVPTFLNCNPTPTRSQGTNLTDLTEEQERFIYYYSTVVRLAPAFRTLIYNAYFNAAMNTSGMIYATFYVRWGQRYDLETIALCEEVWSDPTLFGLKSCVREIIG